MLIWLVPLKSFPGMNGLYDYRPNTKLRGLIGPLGELISGCRWIVHREIDTWQSNRIDIGSPLEFHCHARNQQVWFAHVSLRIKETQEKVPKWLLKLVETWKWCLLFKRGLISCNMIYLCIWFGFFVLRAI